MFTCQSYLHFRRQDINYTNEDKSWRELFTVLLFQNCIKIIKKKRAGGGDNKYQLKSNHQLIDTRCIFKKIKEEKIEKNGTEHVLYDELEQTNALHLSVLKENSHSW